jgi:hypothetical protein
MLDYDTIAPHAVELATSTLGHILDLEEEAATAAIDKLATLTPHELQRIAYACRRLANLVDNLYLARLNHLAVDHATRHTDDLADARSQGHA